MVYFVRLSFSFWVSLHLALRWEDWNRLDFVVKLNTMPFPVTKIDHGHFQSLCFCSTLTQFTNDGLRADRWRLQRKLWCQAMLNAEEEPWVHTKARLKPSRQQTFFSCTSKVKASWVEFSKYCQFDNSVRSSASSQNSWLCLFRNPWSHLFIRCLHNNTLFVGRDFSMQFVTIYLNIFEADSPISSQVG